LASGKAPREARDRYGAVSALEPSKRTGGQISPSHVAFYCCWSARIHNAGYSAQTSRFYLQADPRRVLAAGRQINWLDTAMNRWFRFGSGSGNRTRYFSPLKTCHADASVSAPYHHSYHLSLGTVLDADRRCQSGRWSSRRAASISAWVARLGVSPFFGTKFLERLPQCFPARGPAALAVSTNRADSSALSGLGLNLIERTFTEIRVI
jgi:hypothetical protein